MDYSLTIFSGYPSSLTKLVNSFPLDSESIKTFKNFKEEIEKVLLHSVDEKIPLVVETDASDTAIAATQNQANCPVAFFSHTLMTTEQKHSSIEKEACAIVESVKKWSHYLSVQRFVIVTDQQAVNFMFDARRHGKIKNSKIKRWRMELGCYEYDIMYRTGKNNMPSAMHSTTWKDCMKYMKIFVIRV